MMAPCRCTKLPLTSLSSDQQRILLSRSKATTTEPHYIQSLHLTASLNSSPRRKSITHRDRLSRKASAFPYPAPLSPADSKPSTSPVLSVPDVLSPSAP